APGRPEPASDARARADGVDSRDAVTLSRRFGPDLQERAGVVHARRRHVRRVLEQRAHRAAERAVRAVLGSDAPRLDFVVIVADFWRHFARLSTNDRALEKASARAC